MNNSDFAELLKAHTVAAEQISRDVIRACGGKPAFACAMGIAMAIVEVEAQTGSNGDTFNFLLENIREFNASKNSRN